MAVLPVALLTAALAAGCAAQGEAPATGPATSAPPTTAPPTSTSPTTEPTTAPTTTPTKPRPGTVPPAWLGTRPLPTTAAGYGEVRPTPRALRNRRFTFPDRLPMLPGRGFQAQVSSPAPPEVIARSTWAPACPVAATDLSWVRLTFRGFDGRRHTGELLVATGVADDVVTVFHELWRERFPIERMTITTKAEQDAPPTGDGNDTGAFDCRPVTGGTSYSQHAHGLAIDVNPFQNPYLKGDVVLPELASAYLDRADARPGMILPGSVVVRAFERIGWGWGGAWRSLKDYQHFSANDR